MTEARANLPVAMRFLGWSVAPGTWLLAVRLAWEATVLTAREGPQMIGFTFMHTSPLALPVTLSVLVAEIWVVLAIIWCAYTAWRKRHIDRLAWIQLGSLVVPLSILLFIPANT
jgi:hypothetical protein